MGEVWRGIANPPFHVGKRSWYFMIHSVWKDILETPPVCSWLTRALQSSWLNSLFHDISWGLFASLTFSYWIFLNRPSPAEAFVLFVYHQFHSCSIDVSFVCSSNYLLYDVSLMVPELRHIPSVLQNQALASRVAMVQAASGSTLCVDYLTDIVV